jgi:formylglycine-generating enzyme required for sulfatase activity
VAAALLVLATVVGVAWRNGLEKRRENEQLLELRSAQALVASIEELFPAGPAKVATMDRWLADVDRVLRHAPEHRARLEAARTAKRTDEIALLELPVLDMERLRTDLRPQVAEWRARAADLVRLSLDVDDRKWREAIAEIAQLAVYHGLVLTKQLGLVPLRRDPGSGLWEFWHVLSGERPLVEPTRPDRYALTESSGIVLVLEPGGDTELGWPPESSLTNTSSVLHSSHVAPFFVGKYEVTQAQWQRVMASNPSTYQEGIVLARNSDTHEPTRVSSHLHPVESVNWQDCQRFVHRIDLELPTEDQWEHAARGGAEGLFWWNPERRVDPSPRIQLGAADLAAFQGRENVADACAADSMGFGLVAWDDGYPFHAPVGTFAPNPFGLFDVLGNVSEWCSDRNDDPHVKLDRRIVRGANWFTADAALLALCARGWDSALVEQSVRGLRVARALR